MVGTIMAGNVFFMIIPNQNKTVDRLPKGEEPDPIWGYQANQRSIHNNDLIRSVVFPRLSNPASLTNSFRWC